MTHHRIHCLVLTGLLLAGNAFAADYGFQVMRADLRHSQDDYELNADIDYRFSEPAIDALNNGVPLTLMIRFKVERERPFWRNERLASEKWHVRIRYHSLSKLFQLVDEKRGLQKNFVSFQAMLDTMSTIRGLPVLKADALSSGQAYLAKLSVKLNIEELPLPLRPVAYLTPKWYLDSGWYRWPFIG
jgi:hypothetical protein